MTTLHTTPIQALFENSNLELDLSKNADGHYLNEVARYAWMNWTTAYSLGREHRGNILNKDIEIALAEANAQPEPVEPQQAAWPQPPKKEPHAELRALYAQQFQRKTLDCYLWEFLNENGEYQHCFSTHDGVASEPLWLPHKTYRCTPKPTCQVKNLDTGELKTMMREAAKLLQAELGDTVEWLLNGFTKPSLGGFDFGTDGIYTYKTKATIKLDGEMVTRDQAVAEWEAKKDAWHPWLGWVSEERRV